MSMNGWRNAELERQRKEQLRLEQVRSQAVALLAACETEIAAIKDAAVQQVAAKGLQQVRKELEQASSQVGDNPDQALKAVRSSQKHLHRVIAEAQAAAHRWSQEQAASQARIDEVRTRAEAEKKEGNKAGEVALAQVRAALQQATALHKQGRYLEAMASCAEAETRIEEASTAAFDETVRREVVGSLLATLKERGFVLESPRVQNNETDGGIVTLSGTLPSGKRARFEVQLDGKMKYDLDGYEGRTCAAEVDQIEQILRDRFRVKLGPAQVTWKNPDRISKGARNIPSGSRQRG